MTRKLLLVTEKSWRRINAPHLMTLVKFRAEFPNDQSNIFQSEPTHEFVPSGEEDFFSEDPPIFAAKEMATHNIG